MSLLPDVVEYNSNMRQTLIILAFVIASCSKTSDHKTESTKNDEIQTLDSNVDKNQKDADSIKIIDESIPEKFKQDTFELSQLKGAWFDDPTENGLFYIDDSIFYLDANESYPIWVSIDSLLIDFGYDINGFQIYKENDTIKLVPLSGSEEKPLFRLD